MLRYFAEYLEWISELARLPRLGARSSDGSLVQDLDVVRPRGVWKEQFSKYMFGRKVDELDPVLLALPGRESKPAGTLLKD